MYFGEWSALLSHDTTYLHVFQTVLLANTSEDVLLAAFLHLTSEEELIENEVCLLKVEDNIELAHIAIIFVHLFDEAMHDLQGNELVIRRVYPGDEEKGGIAPIDNLGIFASSSAVHSSGGTRVIKTNPCTLGSCTFLYDGQGLAERHL